MERMLRRCWKQKPPERKAAIPPWPQSVAYLILVLGGCSFKAALPGCWPPSSGWLGKLARGATLSRGFSGHRAILRQLPTPGRVRTKYTPSIHLARNSWKFPNLVKHNQSNSKPHSSVLPGEPLPGAGAARCCPACGDKPAVIAAAASTRYLHVSCARSFAALFPCSFRHHTSASRWPCRCWPC